MLIARYIQVGYRCPLHWITVCEYRHTGTLNVRGFDGADVIVLLRGLQEQLVDGFGCVARILGTEREAY